MPVPWFFLEKIVFLFKYFKIFCSKLIKYPWIRIPIQIGSIFRTRIQIECIWIRNTAAVKQDFVIFFVLGSGTGSYLHNVLVCWCSGGVADWRELGPGAAGPPVPDQNQHQEAHQNLHHPLPIRRCQQVRVVLNHFVNNVWRKKRISLKV